MKSLKITAVLVALPLVASAQDAAKVDSKHYKVLLDNAVVRVLKVGYGVGEKSPMHSHPDAVLVALANGKARFTMPDGKTQDVEITADGGLYTPAFTHAPENIGAGPIDAILVEIKPKTGAAATLPAARPGMANTVLAEGPGAVANRATLAPDFQEAKGSTHEFDQVVIALGPSDLTLAVEGGPSVTKWQRGDVQFIGRGVKHEAKNGSGKPVDVVIVVLK
jgi:quercetin dioxygenase-like cupin family protein